MESLHVTLFGKFCAQRGERKLDGFDSQKVQELFCYLLLNRRRPHPRETLASVLWDHCSTAQSRMYLRRLLWQLQQALHAGTRPEEKDLLLVEKDWVHIDPAADLWLDVTAFEAAYNRVRGVPGQLLKPETVQALREAVQLYKSDLLENWYQDWCLFERERLQTMYLAMLDKLVDYCEAHHEYEVGLDYGKRILRIDRAREHTHRRLMRLLYLAGNRTGALRQYERCAVVLKEELDVEPARRTAMLYEQIRADQMEEIAGNPVLAKPASEKTHQTLPDQLDYIINLQHMITSVQQHIQHEIEMIEHSLHLK